MFLFYFTHREITGICIYEWLDSTQRECPVVVIIDDPQDDIIVQWINLKYIFKKHFRTFVSLIDMAGIGNYQ